MAFIPVFFHTLKIAILTNTYRSFAYYYYFFLIYHFINISSCALKQTIAGKSLKHDWAGKTDVGQMRIILTDSETNEKTPETTGPTVDGTYLDM